MEAQASHVERLLEYINQVSKIAEYKISKESQACFYILTVIYVKEKENNLQ